MSPPPRALELALARQALAEGVVAAPALSLALLHWSAAGLRKPMLEVLAEQAGADRGRLQAIASRLPPPPPAGDAKPQQVRKKVGNVRCDLLVEEQAHWSTFLGKRPDDPQPVTLQLISPEALKHGLWMDFLETVRAARAVRSVNVLEVLDVSRAPEGFAIVSRFHPGAITLDRLLERVHRLKLSEALRVIRELAQGLRDLHAAGLSHRDASPRNALLTRDGHVLIQRAGVVWEAPGVAEAGLPRGVVFGSPHHLGPEVLRGDPPSPASDIYALGVCAYTMITGVCPFEGPGLRELAPQHTSQAPAKPHEVLRELPDSVSDLLVWMLSKAPKDRPDAIKLVNVIQTLEKNVERSGRTQRFQAFGQ